jgi:predicted nucleic acid-binding protein
MSTLLDTGILLRLVDKKDALHMLVEQAVDALIARQGRVADYNAEHR